MKNNNKRLRQSNFFILNVLFIVLFTSLTNSTLLITAPLINKFPNSTVPYSYANFGNIPYGKTLVFDLVNFEISLC